MERKRMVLVCVSAGILALALFGSELSPQPHRRSTAGTASASDLEPRLKAFLERMPTIQAVQEKISGKDEFDRAARRSAAFGELNSMVQKLLRTDPYIGGDVYIFPGIIRHARHVFNYNPYSRTELGNVNRKYKGPAERKRLRQLSHRYWKDKQFKQYVRTTLLSAEMQREYQALLTEARRFDQQKYVAFCARNREQKICASADMPGPVWRPSPDHKVFMSLIDEWNKAKESIRGSDTEVVKADTQNRFRKRQIGRRVSFRHMCLRNVRESAFGYLATFWLPPSPQNGKCPALAGAFGGPENPDANNIRVGNYHAPLVYLEIQNKRLALAYRKGQMYTISGRISEYQLAFLDLTTTLPLKVNPSRPQTYFLGFSRLSLK